MLGCKTYTRYTWYETDELPRSQGQPNPRKIRLKSDVWATFSHSKIVFRGLGLTLYRKQTTINPTQPTFSANTLVLLIVLILIGRDQDELWRGTLAYQGASIAISRMYYTIQAGTSCSWHEVDCRQTQEAGKEGEKEKRGLGDKMMIATGGDHVCMRKRERWGDGESITVCSKAHVNAECNTPEYLV